MGRLVGFLLLVRVERDYGFSFQKLCFFQRKDLRTPLTRAEPTTKRVLILTHSYKKDDNKCHHLFYGASNGTRHEPGVNMYAKIAHICLHDEETIDKVKLFLKL